MPERKTSEVDGVSKAEYEENLETNVSALISRPCGNRILSSFKEK